jgi:hypothetical protein
MQFTAIWEISDPTTVGLSVHLEGAHFGVDTSIGVK